MRKLLVLLLLHHVYDAMRKVSVWAGVAAVWCEGGGLESV